MDSLGRNESIKRSWSKSFCLKDKRNFYYIGKSIKEIDEGTLEAVNIQRKNPETELRFELSKMTV